MGIKFSGILFLLYILVDHSAFGQNLSTIPEFVVEKTQEVEIKFEKFKKISGFIQVNEDRESEHPKLIRIPVIIYKSSNPSPLEPVFRLAGGPGESNIPKSISNSGLLHNHDFVFVGYRGVDGSTYFNSRKLKKSLKGKGNKLLSDESLDKIEFEAKRFLDNLKSEQIDISSYSIMDVIEDLEDVRKTLGYNKVNLLSGSYGTRVALLYSYKYPESIHRTVMNGANPPGHFLWYPQKTEEILEKWDSIFIANYYTPIKEKMAKALENMPERWLVFKLDKDKIKAGTFISLFSTKTSIMAFDAYNSAAIRGNYSGLFLIQMAYDIFVHFITWGDMFQKGFSADFNPEINYREYLRSFETKTTLGPNFSLLLWGSAGTWQSGLIPEEFRALRNSDTETLILSGDLDVSTPVDFTVEKLLPFMSHAQHIILQNMSHTDVANAQPLAYHKTVNIFFLTGKADRSIFMDQKIDFQPIYQLDKIAQFGLLGIIILMALFFFTFWYLLKIKTKP